VTYDKPKRIYSVHIVFICRFALEGINEGLSFDVDNLELVSLVLRIGDIIMEAVLHIVNVLHSLIFVDVSSKEE
jgi:hypothetical protein